VVTIARDDELTIADLSEMFGPMPDRRIVREPAPGTASERDVLAIHARDNRLCELVDGKVGQTLTGGTVVPGFKLRLQELFAALDGR
jgi:hypothetical protein